MMQYEWRQFALIYTLDSEQRKCDFLQQDLEVLSVPIIRHRLMVAFRRQ